MNLRFNRRQLLQGGLILGASGATGAAYAGWVEPRHRVVVKQYRLQPKAWRAGQRLKIAFISDIHASEPYMPLKRVADILEAVNELSPDLILLGGDYCGGAINKPFLGPHLVAPLLTRLHAPLGCHAIFGNHDYNVGIGHVRRAFDRANISTLVNSALRIEAPGGAFWLAGTDSALAYWLRRDADPGPIERPIITLQGRHFRGADDLPAALAAVKDDAPVILLAHEPDQFVNVPQRVALTLSGHTHGGQVYIPGVGRPIVPSLYGERFAYGHIIEDERHLIVSAGLGVSFIPVRAFCPPEITLVELS